MTIRGYARAAGLALVLLGVVGLLISTSIIQPVDDVLHLAVGALLAYAGFGRISDRGARIVVAATGAFYLLEGVAGPIQALLDELPITAYRNGTDLIHVLFGLLSLFVATLLPDDSAPPEISQRHR